MSSASSEKHLSNDVISALILLGRDSTIDNVMNALKVHGDRPEVINALLKGASYWDRHTNRYQTEVQIIHNGITTYRERMNKTPTPSTLQQILDEMRAMREEITALRAQIADAYDTTKPVNLSKPKTADDQPQPPKPD